ncbi:DUF6231 family protein [Psychrobacter sp. FDAARGOS_221]|uniref:DUF6231 family protein n=1 Tax=Psychrobacter sp. FDAARGOS_221 TaxID=1975705 RepID=UPI000C9ED927|nr:DUF6231 family protein [Psychrobacter sp. FDAARGOS_221]PNK61682.1 hypothetical protein A6J60_012940 [Psychrobacter sp. FDAARGOS_221]
MPTPPATHTTATIDAIFQHLCHVINYLANQDSPKDNSTDQTSTADAFSLLLICDADINDSLLTPLKQTFNQIKVRASTATDFVNAAFDSRYNLSCFIDAQLIDNKQPLIDNTNSTSQPQHTSSASSNTSEVRPDKLKQQQTIAIRLRDLFAQQSVLFISAPKVDAEHKQVNNLNGLGYILTPIDVAHNETNEDAPSANHTKLQCWQFNLYDYKQRPDWLNAKYWANPENFDKYRW